jgi:hypothetical protein
VSTIDARIYGDVTGQVAIGENILQIGPVYGGVVNVAKPPARHPRPLPVSLRPRPFRDLLDREQEVLAAAGEPIAALEFAAGEGTGKTALLRHLAHHEAADAFPDGVVYLSGRARPLDDILQSLYDAFVETEAPVKATEADVRFALQEKRALVIVDDLELGREDVDELLSVAPRSGFVLASSERRLWEGRALKLGGLPLDASLELIERELGRALTPDERPAAEALAGAVGGSPLRLLQAAALVREEGRTFAQVAQELEPADEEERTRVLVAPLSSDEQETLATLAVSEEASTEELAVLTGLNVRPAIDMLERRRLVRQEQGRYRAGAAATAALGGEAALAATAERAADQMTVWAEEHRRDPKKIAAAAPAILSLLAWAERGGRWGQVKRLARAAEGGLALAGRWGAWALVLDSALEAARQLTDGLEEAWALHQLGTRALTLGEDAARDLLEQALNLREQLDDRIGAALTRHNLEFLGGAPAPPDGDDSAQLDRTTYSGGSRLGLFLGAKTLALATALLLAGGAGATWYWGIRDPDPPAPEDVQTAPIGTETGSGDAVTTDGGTTVAEANGPNLVISKFDLGTPVTGREQLLVPIEFEVTNEGDEAAPSFKVTTSFQDQFAPFKLDVSRAVGPVFSGDDLGAGEAIVFRGVVLLEPTLSAQEGPIAAKADSCVGDELIDDPPCRVMESNEEDNEAREDAGLPVLPELMIERLDNDGVRVVNRGIVPAGPFVVRVTIQDPTAEEPQFTVIEFREGLKAKESVFQGFPCQSAEKEVTALADAERQVTESAEDNNGATSSGECTVIK